jgi:hypothetical protein
VRYLVYHRGKLYFYIRIHECVFSAGMVIEKEIGKLHAMVLS